MEPNPYVSPESPNPKTQVAATHQTWPQIIKIVFILWTCVTAMAGLWCIPLASFHHMELWGLFGWLFINGEDPDRNSIFYWQGREYWPTCGLIPTLVASTVVLWIAWKACGKVRGAMHAKH